jgi:hypothetical protein
VYINSIFTKYGILVFDEEFLALDPRWTFLNMPEVKNVQYWLTDHIELFMFLWQPTGMLHIELPGTVGVSATL